MRNGPQRLTDLSTWSQGGSTVSKVMRPLRGSTLLEEACHWGMSFESLGHCTISYLEKDLSFLLQLSTAMYSPPLWIASGTLRQNKPLFLLPVFSHGVVQQQEKGTDKAAKVSVWQTHVFHILPGSTAPSLGKRLIKQ